MAVDAAADEGVTPLFIACQNGHDAVVAQLLKAGANVNAADDDDWIIQSLTYQSFVVFISI